MGLDLELPNPIDPAFGGQMDKDFVEYYNKNLAIVPPTHVIDLADVRANPQKWASPWCKDYSDLPFVNDMKIASGDGHQFLVRIYQPDVERFGSGPFPVHVNFHGTHLSLTSMTLAVYLLSISIGGGYCFGDLTSDGALCMKTRTEVGLIVVDVDYRLTPGQYQLRADYIYPLMSD